MDSVLSLPGRYFSRVLHDGAGGYREETLRLPTSATALLLIDVDGTGFSPGESPPSFANDFERDHFKAVKSVVCDHIAPSLASARQAGLKIIYVNNCWPPMAWKQGEFGLLLERVLGTRWPDEAAAGQERPAVEFTAALRPRPGELFVPKQMYDGFFETPLDTLLRNLGIHNLICAGFAADICVLGTALGALNRNYRAVVLRDATLAGEFADTLAERRMTAAAIRLIEVSAGFTATSTQFAEACRASG